MSVALTATTREALRARLFLKALLPLLETVLEQTPKAAAPFAGVDAQLAFSASGLPFGASLQFSRGRLRVSADIPQNPTISCHFSDSAALNRFFSGGLVLPRVVGLRHPLLLAKLLRLLLTLQVLQPGPWPREPAEQALRVRLVLGLVTRALPQLYWGGYPPMVELVDGSPDRVYQWTVEREGIGVWLRMCQGKLKTGIGQYPHRAPFVHFVFPDVDRALSVFTASEHMSGVREGAVQTLGCPEYTRKVASMMQAMDQLLVEG